AEPDWEHMDFTRFSDMQGTAQDGHTTWVVPDSGAPDYEQGYKQMMAGIAMWRRLGDPQSIALGLNFLIQTLITLGRFEEAKTCMQESIALCEQSGNRWGLGTAYRYLGLTYLAEGQLTTAKTHLLKSLEIFGDFSVGWDIARSLAYLGDVAVQEGNHSEARRVYQEALVCALEANATPIALDALLGLAELDARNGKPEKAIVLCFYILNHPASEDETKHRAGRLRVELESGLSSKVVSTALELASDVSMELVFRESQDIATSAELRPD
ncbi:MAG: tetratricopeptide repeat protein, partial [Anaerolineales bacterium]